MNGFVQLLIVKITFRQALHITAMVLDELKSGELVRVEAPPGQVFQTAEIRPSADFSRLEEVFVGLSEEPRGSP